MSIHEGRGVEEEEEKEAEKRRSQKLPIFASFVTLKDPRREVRREKIQPVLFLFSLHQQDATFSWNSFHVNPFAY